MVQKISPAEWRAGQIGGRGVVINRQPSQLSNGLRVGYYPPGENSGPASATVEDGTAEYHFGWSEQWNWYVWGGSSYGHASGMPRIAQDWESTNPENLQHRMTYFIAPPEWQKMLDDAYPFTGDK